MNAKQWQSGAGFVLMIVGFVTLVGLYLADRSAEPDVPPPDGPDLYAVFATNENHAQARQHAATFAEICEAVHETLNWDWQQGEKARITTGEKVAVFRNDTRELTLLGERLSTTYKTLPDVLEQYIDRVAGKKSDALTDEQKTNWLKAFQTLADCASYAAGKL